MHTASTSAPYSKCRRRLAAGNGTYSCGQFQVANELTPAIGCSLVTTLYVTASNRSILLSTMNLGQHTVPGSTGDDFCGAQLELVHWQLSPGMMLGSCLVLGVCVSSFLYRHQQDAPQQSLYFIFTILTCITAGGFARAGMDMIVLAYLPWALCLAMFASPCGHYLMRWAGGRGEVSSSWDTEEQQQQQYSYDEKATFLG